MKKARILSLSLLLLLVLPLSADFVEDIGKKGSTAWDNLILLYKRSVWQELAPLKTIVGAFSQYKDKVMRFPLVDFSDVISDGKGNRYYYYGEKEGSEIVLFTYHDGLSSKLALLNATLGSLGSRYEALGRVIDIQQNWETWETVIFVELCAFHIRSRVCVVVEGNDVALVGQDILDAFVKEWGVMWTHDIPEEVKAVPAGLDPESVAKWFLFFGSISKNLAVWTQLCSVQENAITSANVLRPKGRSWWQIVSSGEREYRFIGADALNSTDTVRVFLYHLSENGLDVGEPMSLTVILEQAGQWRVSSF
ncbi:MAG: hypothetical protein LBD79_07660 [Treponema sp.]|jgi:hypothetical protein|nr:hypothetical protein [Treponema sp.]